MFVLYFTLVLFLVQYGNSQSSTYKFFSQPKTWFQARMSCINEGGHLAIINSEKEENEIARYMKTQEQGQTDWIHLGFHMMFEGEVVDLFGNQLVFQHWDVGQPDSNFKSEQCGSMFHTRVKINDIPCDGKCTYLCEFPKIKNITYPDMYVEKFYIVNRQHLTWPEARRACRNYGGHLAIFKTKQELEMVLTETRLRNIHWFWAGYHNMFKSDDIVLENGDYPQSQYLKWSMLCDRNQKYGAVYYTGETILEDLSVKHASLCEVNKPNCYMNSRHSQIEVKMIEGDTVLESD